MLRASIVKYLSMYPGKPQALDDLAAALPGNSKEDIQKQCEKLRSEALLGRNGANTSVSPYRYYLKAHLHSRRS